jgi:hypothetical protein
MKNFTLLIAILAVGAFAQESGKSKEEKPNDGIAVGIRAGVHLMTMGTLDLSVGWHVGAVRDVLKLADLEDFGSIYLQPGALFFTKTSWFDTQTYWLEVPVVASWKIRNYRFHIGPYVNFGLLGDFEDKVASELSGKHEMNRFDLGLSFGSGVELWKFWLGLSYNYGFISVSDYHDEGSAAVRLTLGWNM